MNFDDRVDGMRSALSELAQRRKVRQQLEDEYAWGDEQDAHRERERQMARDQWRQHARHHRDAMRSGGDGDDAADGAAADGAADGEARDDAMTPAGKHCPGGQPPRKLQPYGQYQRSGLQQPEFPS
jgi:hypothetical protein